ncbi:MAG: hypothetical protein JKY54_05730, partial [Flavobacteriales bacterium]|nr:hypothetical protein [Flavobacteriales bacterium]
MNVLKYSFRLSLIIACCVWLTPNGFAQSVQEDSEIAKNKRLGITKKIQLMNRYPSSQLQKDTVTIMHYGKNGLEVKLERFASKLLQSTTHYRYQGGLLTETSVLNTNGTNGGKTTFEYNSDGKIVKQKWYSAANLSSSEYRYEYDNNGNQISRLQYNTTGRSKYGEYYRYDSLGRQYYKAGTTYYGDTSYRVYKTWKNGLLRETKSVYKNSYSNTTVKELYEKDGKYIGTITTTNYAITRLDLAFDMEGKVISKTTTITNHNGHNSSKAVATFEYDLDNNVIAQKDYSNASILKNSVHYTWRGDELIEKRSMRGGAYIGSSMFEAFPSLNLEITYNFNYQTGRIDFITEHYYNDKQQLKERISFVPDGMLKNIFDMKKPTNPDRIIYKYEEGATHIYSKTNGWGLLKGNALDTIKSTEESGCIVYHIMLKFGGVRKCYIKDEELIKIEDYGHSSIPFYSFFIENGQKYCLAYIEHQEYNERDSLISVMSVINSGDEVKLALTYTANYDGSKKSHEKHWENGKIVRESKYQYKTDTTIQITRANVDR